MDEKDQTSQPFEPEPLRVIGDLETLRVIADPVRVQILEVSVMEPRTVKQIAATLGVPATKLYYPINTMEEHGLLRVVGTRLVSGILEKQYRASAMSFSFDHALLAPDSPSSGEVMSLALSTVLDTTRQDIESIRQASANGLIDFAADAPAHRKLFVVKTLSRLSPSQIADFHARLGALVNEFTNQYDPDPAVQGYSLTVLLHPMQLSPPAGEDDDT
jgi:DNA-binding transcriptional ArsR family regulator